MTTFPVRHSAMNAGASPLVFRYVVRWDAGTAPRPFDGLLSLAICKPRIRTAAKPGDWVIGFRSRSPGEVIYAMQVTERLSLDEYWLDRRFRNRRPGKSAFPDNIYRPDRFGGLVQEPNHVHDAHATAQDFSGLHVLLSERFWYFGENSVPIPNELLGLVHSGIGHAVRKAQAVENPALIERWLSSWPIGMHGAPIGAALTQRAADAWAKSVGKSRSRSACAKL